MASRLLPADTYRAYIEGPVQEVSGTVHPDYFVTAARERATPADGVILELYSSVVGDRPDDPGVPDWARPFDTPPAAGGDWPRSRPDPRCSPPRWTRSRCRTAAGCPATPIG
ncbi:hypothetical protein ACFQ3Z_01825 [Streptomyces nogalater]